MSAVPNVSEPPVSFDVVPTPPFRLDLTVWALKRRHENTWDRWDETTYRRVILVDGAPAEMAVTQSGPLERARLHITLTTAPTDRRPSAQRLEEVARATLRHLLGTEVDLGQFYDDVPNDNQLLGPIVSRLRGLKPPRYEGLFETLVNAVTCQLITLTVGLRILGRLTELCGTSMKSLDGTTVYTFPQPDDVARLSHDALRSIGYSRQKARALLELSEAAMRGELDTDRLAPLTDDAASALLQQFHGVGRWTAEYALLRGLGRLHVFPGDDVGVRRHIEQWLSLEAKSLDYQGVHDVLSPWSPYGGLIYLHMLVKGLADSGTVTA